MKKVSKEHFSNTVLKKDVVLTVTGRGLYTTEYRTRHGGVLIGKTVERPGVGDDEDYTEEDYFTDL